MSILTRHQGRHRRPALTVAADPCDLVQAWADDCWRHLTDEVTFGPWGSGRDLTEAGELAKIDLRDRLTALEVAS